MSDECLICKAERIAINQTPSYLDSDGDITAGSIGSLVAFSAICVLAETQLPANEGSVPMCDEHSNEYEKVVASFASAYAGEMYRLLSQTRKASG